MGPGGLRGLQIRWVGPVRVDRRVRFPCASAIRSLFGFIRSNNWTAMIGEEYVFRGDLARTPLPEMLATIHRHGVPGVMEFTDDEGTTRLYFTDGDVIFATSSNRGESLGDYLLSKGRITEAQLKVSSEELERSPGKRHGSILVQMGFLRSEELGIAVREQVQSILWGLFNWADGRGGVSGRTIPGRRGVQDQDPDAACHLVGVQAHRRCQGGHDEARGAEHGLSPPGPARATWRTSTWRLRSIRCWRWSTAARRCSTCVKEDR